VRERLFPVTWRILWPVRAYLRRSPVPKGKGLIRRRLVLPLLPPSPATFETALPNGARIHRRYQEMLGWMTLMDGGYEQGEAQIARTLVQPGTVAFDVGANVGVMTLQLADRAAKVIAIEASGENVLRLRENVALNGIDNVEVIEAAANDTGTGVIPLYVSTDSAFHSTTQPSDVIAAAGAVMVKAITVDAVWESLGCPAVSFMKVDVDGGELEVLRGAVRLLARDRPALLVETVENLGEEKAGWLGTHGYFEAAVDASIRGTICTAQTPRGSWERTLGSRRFLICATSVHVLLGRWCRQPGAHGVEPPSSDAWEPAPTEGARYPFVATLAPAGAGRMVCGCLS
jgi:FkbM family methyltransferase